MCGIFGIAAKRIVDHHQFCQLGELNKQRGNLAFGYFSGQLAKGLCGHTWVQGRAIRYPQPFDPTLVCQEQAQIMLGHVRAPTGGQSTHLGEIHPFETAAGYLAHNGLLLNHQQFPEWDINPSLSVDSQVILGGIQYHCAHGLETSQAIKSTLECLEGQQACWYWHKQELCLYLWRVMAPIYVSIETDVFRFSSIKSCLAETLLTEGVIYKFSLLDFILKEVRGFLFHSPYQV